MSIDERLRVGGGRLFRADVNLAALEFDDAVLQREDRVILAETDVEAGLILRAALANDDRARGNELAAVHLHPAILRIAVAAVLGGALTLLMCHKSPSLRRSDGDLW